MINLSYVLSQPTPPPEDRNCYTSGNFPKLKSNCKEFYTCAFTNGGYLTSTPKTCGNPNNLFDPRQQTCTPDYKCSDYICVSDQEIGFRFVDANSKTGSTYITCQVNAQGQYYPTMQYCPDKKVFKPFHPAITIGSCV